MRKHYKKTNKKQTSHNIFSFFLFLMIFVLAYGSLRWLDTRLTYIATEISALECKTTANRAIDAALMDTLAELSISADDFYISDTQNMGNISVNTMHLNEFCSVFSQNIDTELAAFTTDRIQIPAGSITGLEMLAHFGPDISFSMQPKGAATVDYDTTIESAGINQVHFQIWLHVDLEIRIINPLHAHSVPMTRKIMLVDTILQGNVPEQYFQFQTDGLAIDRTDKMLLNNNR